MKQLHYLITIALILFMIRPVSAFLNEPQGFRGLVWWQSLYKIEDMAIFKEKGNFKYGYRKDEEFRWARCELEKIVYCFYKNKFFAVYLEARGFGNAVYLKQALIAKYGPDYGSTPRFGLYWKGKITEIGYSYDPQRDLCQVVFLSKEILDRIAGFQNIPLSW